jgi:hypothetical protein
MSTQFIFTSGSGVPAGSYHACFVGIDPYNENLDKGYGEGVLLRFKITSGEYKDLEATRVCSRKFSSKATLPKFAKALRGKDFEAGEKFDFADYIGTKGMVIVEATDSGSTRVATFLKSAE